jgi:hypothetical protein
MSSRTIGAGAEAVLRVIVTPPLALLLAFLARRAADHAPDAEATALACSPSLTLIVTVAPLGAQPVRRGASACNTAWLVICRGRRKGGSGGRASSELPQVASAAPTTSSSSVGAQQALQRSDMPAGIWAAPAPAASPRAVPLHPYRHPHGVPLAHALARARRPFYTKYGRIYVICCQDDMRRSVPHSEAHDATAAARYPFYTGVQLVRLHIEYVSSCAELLSILYSSEYYTVAPCRASQMASWI